MNQERITLIKRSANVGGVLLILMTASRLNSIYFFQAATIPLLLAGLGGFVWACGAVNRNASRLRAVIPAFGMFLATGYACLVGSYLIAKKIIENKYRMNGFEMREGCNLAVAGQVEGELFMLDEHIDETKRESPVDASELKQLQERREAAKRYLDFLQADIRLRGHRGTFPARRNANKRAEQTKPSPLYGPRRRPAAAHPDRSTIRI